MTIKNKVFTLDSQFTKEALPTTNETIDNILISGYASVNVPDRAGDVVPSSVWNAGMENYLKNPVILAFHDHSEPVGRMVEHKIDSKGLWIKARISASSDEVFNKVKDGILTAFSVAFRVLDAEYNSITELFVIKELELLEISVVSVPCNQDTLFSLSKSFDSEEDYKNFKMQFAPESESAKGLESSTEAGGNNQKEIEMDPKQLEQMLADAAKKAAEAATNALIEKQAAEKAAAEKAAAEEQALQERIQKAIAAVTPSTTGAEKLLTELEKRFAEQAETQKKAIDGLEAVLKEKAAELEAVQKSKMSFSDAKKSDVTMAEKETAVLLSRVTRKSIDELKYTAGLREKAGPHLPSNTWELEVSLNMENEIRRRLVMAPLFRAIQMQTNVMTMPVNPEAGTANWVTAFGVANSAGGTGTGAGGTGSPHLLKEITLNSYKVATNEYLNFEEEEDSLIVLMPIVRDAMVRRIARAVDRAFLMGVGSGADPVKGVASYDATSAVVATATGAASVANMLALRKDLGAWGLDPSEITYVVSTDVYYDLIADTSFQTVDKIGDRATLRTGQVGSIGNSPVLVSAEFPTKASGTTSATTNYGAICLAPGNFIVGNQRGLRFDTQDLVETQKKVLVASLRTGMTQITTNLGQGVSVFRWS